MIKRVKMLKTTPGAEDGFTVKNYRAGEFYMMEAGLAKVFVEEMEVAKYEDLVVKRRQVTEVALIEKPNPPEDRFLSEGEQPKEIQRVLPKEAPEGKISLEDPPKTWLGVSIRQKETGLVAKIVKILQYGRTQLSSGEILNYRKVRKDWEIVDGD